MVVNLIVGVDLKTHGIGCKGGIPWNNKADMAWFKKLTTGNAVIMGWTTFVSLHRPLPNRLNIVISPDLDATTLYDNGENVRNARSLEEAITIAENEKYGIAYVMGGGSIYRQYLEKDLIDTMYVDFIDNNDSSLEFDTFFPFNAMHNAKLLDNIETGIVSTNLHSGWVGKPAPYRKGDELSNNRYMMYHRRRVSAKHTADSTYLKLLNDIYYRGQDKDTRAGETISIFPYQAVFDMHDCLPILNTKKVFSKGCFTELLWFLKGDTNIKYLIDNNCHIWDDDAYRYYLQTFMPNIKPDEIRPSKEGFLQQVIEQECFQYIDNNGEAQTYTYGDLGPVYGKQWTNWNGINQIDELINKLKTNPDDRRLIVSAWNVGELKDMALPPCHYMSQWYTTKMTLDERLSYVTVHYPDVDITDPNVLDTYNVPKYKLSVMWSQRSVDTCLGFPYDLLSYSTLAYMIAQIVNMVPDKIYCTLGDTHIYKNQLDDVYFQLIRNPYLFKPAKLQLNKHITNINDFTLDDIKITDYQSYPSIKYKLSVGL